MAMFSNKTKILSSVIVGGLVIFGLLWYFQQQGLIKVFPSAEDKKTKELLTIDESKFHSPEGLTDEQYQEILNRLKQARQKVLDDPGNAQLWFLFGSDLDFFNDHSGANRVWKKTLELQPQNFVASHNMATNYQYFLKDYQKAEYYYRQALWAKSDYTVSYQGLMDLYRYNWKEKKSDFEALVLEAVEKDLPNAAYYYGELVDFYVKEKNLEKAREYLKRLGDISVDSAEKLRDKYSELKK